MADFPPACRPEVEHFCLKKAAGALQTASFPVLLLHARGFIRPHAALLAIAATPPVLADAAAAALLAAVALPPVLAILAAPGALSFVRAGQPHCNERRGQKHIKTGNKSESPRPRAVWVDPGRGPGGVSPDPGLTPGQAYEV